MKHILFYLLVILYIFYIYIYMYLYITHYMNVEQRERKTNVMQDGKASIQQGTGAHVKLSKGIIPFISVDFKVYA